MAATSTDKPRIGISQCLLGDPVRYDGGHKRHPLFTEVLAPFVEWVPVCPEVEAGLGTPREAMWLTGNPASPRLQTVHTKIDLTTTLTTFSQRRVQELRKSDLDGYILKNHSPSCGLHRVKVFGNTGRPSLQGTGIFAEKIQAAFPLLPLEEEGPLSDTLILENFIERLFGYRRWKTLIRHHRLSRRAIVHFHSQHQYVLLAHSRAHYGALVKLVANPEHYTPTELAIAYGALFMEALKVKTTIKKHVNVLQQLACHLKKHVGAIEWTELQDCIRDFQQQGQPLTVPLMLINHYVRVLPVSHLLDQVYLNPHPQELILRHHV